MGCVGYRQHLARHTRTRSRCAAPHEVPTQGKVGNGSAFYVYFGSLVTYLPAVRPRNPGSTGRVLVHLGRLAFEGSKLSVWGSMADDYASKIRGQKASETS